MVTKEQVTINSNNFFIDGVIAGEYQRAKAAITRACQPPRKKIYRSIDSMLKEGFLVGSLKYGNNFIG